MKTKGYHILVVDDDPNVLWVTALALEGEGYRTTPALGGEAAIKALEQWNYDLVLTDLNMPGADGGDVLRKARQSHPLAPVIIMTGNPSQLDDEADFANTPDIVLRKPFNIVELLSSLEGCLCAS